MADQKIDNLTDQVKRLISKMEQTTKEDKLTILVRNMETMQTTVSVQSNLLESLRNSFAIFREDFMKYIETHKLETRKVEEETEERDAKKEGVLEGRLRDFLTRSDIKNPASALRWVFEVIAIIAGLIVTYKALVP